MKKSALYLALSSFALGATALPTAVFANDPPAHETATTATWQGTVEAVSSESLTLKETNGSSVKVELGKQTKYDNDGKSGSMTDLRAGMLVAVQGAKQKDGSVRAKEIRYGKARE